MENYIKTLESQLQSQKNLINSLSVATLTHEDRPESGEIAVQTSPTNLGATADDITPSVSPTKAQEVKSPEARNFVKDVRHTWITVVAFLLSLSLSLLSLSFAVVYCCMIQHMITLFKTRSLNDMLLCCATGDQRESDEKVTENH